MMRWFKKKSKEVEVVEIEKVETVEVEEVVQKNELTIKVKDIKQYLVDQFEYSRELEEKIKEFELKEENEYIPTKHEYNASLVTLEELTRRVEDSKNTIEQKNSTIKRLRVEKDKINDELNTYKINEQHIMQQQNEIDSKRLLIENEIIDKFKIELIDSISETKGNLSKSKIINMIDEVHLKGKYYD